MSTELEPRRSNDFTALESTAVPTKLDDTAADLERRLQQEQDSRCEERFAWCFGVVILMSALIFPHIGWATIPIFLRY